MNSYVALLRGINVGGKAKVEMARLKTAFEELGYKNVSTYINSGNVIFQTDTHPSKLNKEITSKLNETFKLDIKLLTRDIKSISNLVSKVSENWTNDKDQKTDVIFLSEEYDSPEVLKSLKTNPDFEKVVYLPGAIIWNVDRENVARGNGVKIIKSDLYKHSTVRNINTVRKLNSLLMCL